MGAPDATLVTPRLSRREPRARTWRSLKQGLVACIERRYDAIVAVGLAFHEQQPPLERASARPGGKIRGRAPRRTGHNLLLRLLTRRSDTLRFLRDPAVPFSNNEAERDVRMMKLRMKISGGFRSPQGAADFATSEASSRPQESSAGTSSKHCAETRETSQKGSAPLNGARQPGQLP